MKKFIAIILSALLCCSALMAFTACEAPDTATTTDTAEAAQPVRFGEFSYNGIYLQSYAQKQLTLSQAKTLITTHQYSATKTPTVSTYVAKPEQSTVTDILRQYSDCTITTYYYQDGSAERQHKTDILRGSDLETVLTNNSFTAYAQLEAKLLLISSSVLDELEQENIDFKNTPGTEKFPFKDCNTYHKGPNANLIVQTHSYSEIASSVTGGISVSYRQDTETTYDADNKITHWQSSLGILSATPSGSVHQGYILEIDFVWTQKN